MNKPAPFSEHEAPHTAYLVTEMFSRHLADHPFVRAHPGLAGQADAIGEALGALYQAIGSLTADAQG